MPDLGARVALAPPGIPEKSPQILLFWFAEPPFAAQKANEMIFWPHLEAVALTELWVIFLKSA